MNQTFKNDNEINRRDDRFRLVFPDESGFNQPQPAGRHRGLVEDRVFTRVDDYILHLTGYSHEELIGQNAR